MMALLGFLIALALFFHYKRRLRYYRGRYEIEEDEGLSHNAARWHDQWHRHWGDKFERQAQRRSDASQSHARHAWRKFGKAGASDAATTAAGSDPSESRDDRVLRRARQRAGAEAAFYTHLMSYLGVIAFLALTNFLTTRYPWFVWPALGWGIGLFAHYMAVFGSRQIRERFFVPAIEREVRREKRAAHTDKRASIDELSATIAHEIRNPIAAAKSLVQQMGEDPASIENVEYGRVALDELDRVERRISHLLKYAKEEDYHFDHVNIAAIVDASLQQMKGKLDGAGIGVARNYIGGPTLFADAEKLGQVFSNILDNAAEALQENADEKRLDLFIDTIERHVRVRIRDNGAGIPADRIDRIFNPFFSTKEHGTGLGMAIAKKIVEAHEGTIDVASEPGRGTEFVVQLPLPG